MRPEAKLDFRNEHCPHVEDFLFYHRVLPIHVSKDYVFTQANLNNYDGFTNLKEHI